MSLLENIRRILRRGWQQPQIKRTRWSERHIIQRRIITIAFAVVAIAISVGVLVYTQLLVSSLIKREQRLVQFYASILESFANTNSIESLFLLDRVTPTIDFPCIITDSTSNPLEPYDQFTLNITFPNQWDMTRRRNHLQQLIAEMGQEYHPIEIRDQSGRVINYIYYTNSWIVKRLRILPYAEITIVALFIAAGYIALRMQRRRDESLIWVGMAKETAHQLGTPISSMLGWLEILHDQLRSLRSAPGQDQQLWQQPLEELEHDINRLSSVAQRFSLIGSQPKLQPHELTAIVEETVAYVQSRLPKHGKRITIKLSLPEPRMPCIVPVNAELLSWVFENLLKNAAEAIEAPNGTINITVSIPTEGQRKSERIVRITIADNGRGMSATQRRYAFTAGYTTKERGWGLGLSLSKRIIEEYHRGKIYILRTALNRGTTVAIELPLSTEP